MYCNTQHFAGTLPIISISRGHFTLTDIKGTDMEAGRDPDLVKIQNCSEHTKSSWNQIRSWKNQHVKLFPNWSLDCYQKIDLPTEVSVIGSTQEKSKFLANSNSWQITSPSSRWCHDLSVVCWLLTSLRSAVSPWEGGRRNTLENNLCLLFIYLPPSWEWILFARKQSSSLKSGAKYPKKQTSKCASCENVLF